MDALHKCTVYMSRISVDAIPLDGQVVAFLTFSVGVFCI